MSGASCGQTVSTQPMVSAASCRPRRQASAKSEPPPCSDSATPAAKASPAPVTSTTSAGGASGTVNTAGAPLTVRSGPGTGHSAVGSVSDGAGVTIACQTSGTRVDGTYGSSTIWDRIGSGRYIADAYVYTGHDGYIPGVPRC